MKLIQILKLCIFAAFIVTIVTGVIFMVRSSTEEQGRNMKLNPDRAHLTGTGEEQRKEDQKGNEDVHRKFIHHPKKLRSEQEQHLLTPAPLPSTSTTTTEAGSTTPSTTMDLAVLKELKKPSLRPPPIHIFYYPWYGSPEFNGGKYYHWNHRYLANWNPTDKAAYPQGRHKPPSDVASIYYPQLGPYSSWDRKVMEQHLKWISSAGIDVIVVSWYPRGKADPEGFPWDPLVPLLLNVTEQAKMKMAFHLEPYEGRTASSVRQDISYILEQYGSHPAFYRIVRKNSPTEKELPLFYIYDSYKVPASDWASIASQNGTDTIRNTALDSLLIGLFLDKGDEGKIIEAGMDGLYTYFASDGFSYASTIANWPTLSSFCAKNHLLFVPSVGPGYNDTRVRPWNSANSKGREEGEYYRRQMKMANVAKADIVSITSFNEWHEGTQIEPAVPFTDRNVTGHKYAEYEKGPEMYLQLTLELINKHFTAHHSNIPAQIERVV